jgi:hypothetical protein
MVNREPGTGIILGDGTLDFVVIFARALPRKLSTICADGGAVLDALFVS